MKITKGNLTEAFIVTLIVCLTVSPANADILEGIRKRYRISPITTPDMQEYCNNHYGYTNAYNIKARRLPNDSKRFGCDVNTNINSEYHRKNDRDNGGFGFSESNVQIRNSKEIYRKEFNNSFETKYVEYNSLCKGKHSYRGRSAGAYVGDGGYSCYDSYIKWRR